MAKVGRLIKIDMDLCSGVGLWYNEQVGEGVRPATRVGAASVVSLEHGALEGTLRRHLVGA